MIDADVVGREAQAIDDQEWEWALEEWREKERGPARRPKAGNPGAHSCNLCGDPATEKRLLDDQLIYVCGLCLERA